MTLYRGSRSRASGQLEPPAAREGSPCPRRWPTRDQCAGTVAQQVRATVGHQLPSTTLSSCAFPSSAWAPGAVSAPSAVCGVRSAGRSRHAGPCPEHLQTAPRPAGKAGEHSFLAVFLEASFWLCLPHLPQERVPWTGAVSPKALGTVPPTHLVEAACPCNPLVPCPGRCPGRPRPPVTALPTAVLAPSPVPRAKDSSGFGG